MATGGPPSSAADAGVPIRVFVSYRRTDDSNFIGRLYDRLIDSFGDENVFRDIDSIAAGSDFSVVIRETLANVDAVVALIGRNWQADRLADERDFVRMELVDALARRLPIIPVLIEDTPLPEATALPEALRPLLSINVARIRRDPDFRRDATRAIDDITALARAEQRRRQVAAEAAEHEAEAERRKAAAEQAAREAAETERQRLEREAALATAEAVAAERRAIADRLAREHAERTAEIRRLEDEYAARRLAEERARLADLTEAQQAAATEAAAAAAAADELRRTQTAPASSDDESVVDPDGGLTAAGDAGDESPEPGSEERAGAPDTSQAASTARIEHPAPPILGDSPHGGPTTSRRGRWVAMSAAVVLIAGLVVVLIATQRDPDDSDDPVSATTSVVATFPADVTLPDLALAGTTVTLSRFQTSDAVQDSLEDALDAFADEQGMTISYEVMTDLEADLDVRVDAGNPPDVAIVPAGPIFTDFAERGVLQALPADVTSSLAENWHEDWLGFWNVGGTQFGVPSESGLKSLVWYVPSAFADRGYEVPASLTDFFALVDQMIADGETPLCVGIESGAATGWPFTDWTEDFVLRQQGIDYYRQWIAHEIPFNDPGVVAAMAAVADLWALDGAVLASGSIAETNFADSALPLLDGGCLMHRQADFFAPVFPVGTAFGTGPDEVSAFYFPSDVDRPTLVSSVGAVAFRDAPEVWAVLEYLASPEYADARQSAQAAWGGDPTRPSGFLTANQAVDRALFTDTEIGSLEILATGSPAALDASDLMPPAVGAGAFWTEATALVKGEQDAQTAADNIEAAWPP